jgi:phage tail tube protein FII
MLTFQTWVCRAPEIKLPKLTDSSGEYKNIYVKQTVSLTVSSFKAYS